MIIQMQSGWFTHFTVGVSTLNIIQMQSGWFTHFWGFHT